MPPPLRPSAGCASRIPRASPGSGRVCAMRLSSAGNKYDCISNVHFKAFQPGGQGRPRKDKGVRTDLIGSDTKGFECIKNEESRQASHARQAKGQGRVGRPGRQARQARQARHHRKYLFCRTETWLPPDCTCFVERKPPMYALARRLSTQTRIV